MKGNYSSSDKLELDLSFTSLSVADLEVNVDDVTINLMKNSCLWLVDIANWISFIQSDQKLLCHTVIRNARKISLGLELTNDNKISELNQNWRGQFKSTDVLSFPIIDGLSFVPRDECIELGDIVISVPTAIRQAKENNIDLARELRWLASHGFLHLLGWEHCDEVSLNLMLLTQEQLLDLRGIL